jgi:hemerythrin-like metal-binding protein
MCLSIRAELELSAVTCGAASEGAEAGAVALFDADADKDFCTLPITCPGDNTRHAKWSVLVLSSRSGEAEEIAAILGADFAVRQTTLFDGIESAIRSFSPDLVFLEWATAGIDGEAVCAELAAHPEMNGVHYLVLDCPLDPDRRAAAREAGAAGFLERPLCPRLLRQMARSELRLIERIRELSTARQRATDVKDVLVGLLQTASQVISIKSQFEMILDSAHSVSWFEATGDGAIFLSDEDGNLTLAFARGIASSLEQPCIEPSNITCLCRQVTANQRPSYVSDSTQLKCFPEKEEARGIHILPLLREGKTLGVLMLFVRAGRLPRADEMEFASELAITSAALTSRRLMEATLEINNYEVELAHAEVIRLLGLAGDRRDTDTGLHVFRVGHFSRCIALAAGLSAEQADILLQAAPMHDIGKIGIPDSILLKPGRLTPEEFVQMQAHTLIGEQILQGRQPLIEAARVIAGSHHERWDGKGYPRGLKGEQISIFGRICTLADVFDALGQIRPYKRAWRQDEITTYVRENAGTQFDPLLVNAFFSALPDILRFQNLYGDAAALSHGPIYLTPFAQANHGVVQWSEAFSVGVPIIDEHHRYLFDLSNAVWDALHGSGTAVDIAKSLTALLNYTKIHFSEEERLMVRHGYVHAEAHALEHSSFITSVETSWESLRKNPLISGLKIFQFLSSWLVQHVQGADASAFRAIAAEIQQSDRPNGSFPPVCAL